MSSVAGELSVGTCTMRCWNIARDGLLAVVSHDEVLPPTALVANDEAGTLAVAIEMLIPGVPGVSVALDVSDEVSDDAGIETNIVFRVVMVVLVVPSIVVVSSGTQAGSDTVTVWVTVAGFVTVIESVTVIGTIGEGNPVLAGDSVEEPSIVSVMSPYPYPPCGVLARTGEAMSPTIAMTLAETMLQMSDFDSE